jgi:hypothetical protein
MNRIDMFGIQPRRFTKTVQRAVAVPDPHQDDTVIIVGVSVFRSKAQGFAVKR